MSLGIALHVLPIALLVLKAMLPPSVEEEEKPLVAKPVIAATLLKLGTRSTRKSSPIASCRSSAPPPSRTSSLPATSRSESTPTPVRRPRPNTHESDITRLIAKSDPFAEDAGKVRPEEGRAAGVDGGLETDPNKVHAGDKYAALLGKFFHERHQIPTVISEGEARNFVRSSRSTSANDGDLASCSRSRCGRAATPSSTTPRERCSRSSSTTTPRFRTPPEGGGGVQGPHEGDRPSGGCK